jgi:hypothetical protein
MEGFFLCLETWMEGHPSNTSSPGRWNPKSFIKIPSHSSCFSVSLLASERCNEKSLRRNGTRKVNFWWFRPVIPAIRKLRHKFKASLGYIVRPCLKKKKKKKKGNLFS